MFPYEPMVRVSLWLSRRRCRCSAGELATSLDQADDGLIVLRTVRNLLAGNGPVFNQGSPRTAWTYSACGRLGGRADAPEYVALALAMVLSLLGMVLLMLGTGWLYAPSLRGRRAIMLPAGALVYRGATGLRLRHLA